MKNTANNADIKKMLQKKEYEKSCKKKNTHLQLRSA
jgi:hypothetical protein